MTHRTLALLALAACDAGTGPPAPQASSVRALAAIYGGGGLTAIVDGRTIASGLAFGQLTRSTALVPGNHTLLMTPSDSTHTLSLVFTAVAGVGLTAVVIDSTASATRIIDPVLVSDTGATPATDRARLRLADFAAAAPPVDAYRTQPDSAGLRLTAAPLTFRAVTPYVDGAPGSWSVVLSHTGRSDTILATGALALAAGQAETVVVLDSSAGTLTWRVVRDRD